MAETAQPETAPEAPTREDIPDTPAHADQATALQLRTADPALQPIDTRPLRHVHHGQTAAMWTATSSVFAGFLIGAVLFVMHLQTAGIVVGGVLCIAGIAAGLILQALGLGLYAKKKS